MLEIDIRDVQLPRQKLQKLNLIDVAVLHQGSAQLATGRLLLREGGVELKLGDEFVLGQ